MDQIEKCGILHGTAPAQPTDADGCLLPMGHDGPHEFQDPSGQRWLWETDIECECEHCQLCEGDYCTIYWRKPDGPPAPTPAQLAARVAELEQECERLRPLAAPIEIDGHKLMPADVLRRMIRGARPRRGKLKWVAVHEATAHGSTISAGLCRWAGVDPDTGAALSAHGADGPKE